MTSKKLEEIEAKAKELVADAGTIESWVRVDSLIGEVRSRYERWYVAALRLVSGVLDDEEVKRFVQAYTHYAIQGYLTNTNPTAYQDNFAAMLARQKGLVAAIPDVVKAKALKLRILVVGDVFDDETEKARMLLEQGLVREAGVIGGVVLEGHLKLVHDQNGLEYSQTDSIVDLAQCLRKRQVLTLGDEKKIIAMADTRNKCAHRRDREPTFEEVQDFLDDVERFMKRTRIA
jgi:hypothetical protein